MVLLPRYMALWCRHPDALGHRSLQRHERRGPAPGDLRTPKGPELESSSSESLHPYRDRWLVAGSDGGAPRAFLRGRCRHCGDVQSNRLRQSWPGQPGCWGEAFLGPAREASGTAFSGEPGGDNPALTGA